MSMSDSSAGGIQLMESWRSLGHRVAVAAGCLVGLLALLHHVPVSTASLRGGATWFGVLVLFRLGGIALERALAFDRAAAEPEEAASE